MSAEPQIQYALTEDGVSIGFWTLGEGRPFVLPPGGLAVPSLRAWRTMEGREFLERLAANRMIVRYDRRGVGASQATAIDISPDAHSQDLSAVLDKVGRDRVDLCAYMDSGPAVLRYVSRNPQRVSRLVLWGCSPHETRYVNDEVLAILEELRKADFELFREAFLAAVLRYQGRDLRAADEYTQSLREAFNPAWDFAVVPTDVTRDLERITAPTLVLHRRGMARPPMTEIQTLAARIPNARLVLLEGDAMSPYAGDVDAVLATIEEFLGDGKVPDPVGATPQAAGAAGTRTILFTDLVGHTEMMQRLGDAKGRDVLRDHERITREALAAHGGMEVKTDGDSFMASFASVSAAVDCAVGLQRAFAQYSEINGEPIVVRMGLNVGEPIEEDGDFFGSAVILGARIKDRARGGEILVPEAMRHMLSGKNFLFSDRGETILKGFEDAVRLYEVRWRE